MKKSVLILLIAFFTMQLTAQQNYNFITPNTEQFEQERFCGRFSTIFKHQSKEIAFGIGEDVQHNLYFRFNNLEWFQSLFKNTKDGISVAIITKDEFNCKRNELPSEIMGHTLKPVYKNNLIKGVKKIQEGYYQVLVGKLPSKYYQKEIEFNILMLNNGYLCRYQTSYNLQSFNYDLLDMGLYLDSLVYNQNYHKINDLNDLKIAYKTLQFEIPFKKSATSFSVNDIRALYDSLRITDYNIKKIDIKAYSSIEGSKERNEVLQKQRAQSIIDALQTFQKPHIETVVSTAENWVEFLTDIKNTEHAHLIELPKSKIKEMLSNSTASEFEVYLQNHRKGLITLYLDKIDNYPEFSENQLMENFNISISSEDVDEAKRIQNTLFERMKSKTVNPDLLYEMNIPKQKKFFDILHENAIFRAQLNRQNMFSSYYDLEELDKLMPGNKKVAYNLVALKLRINHSLQAMSDEIGLIQKIFNLKNMGIEEHLVQRLLVNYHIINAQLLMQKGAYEKKDESVQFILNNYKKFPINDDDYLSLAQFVTYHYDRPTAIELLADRVNQIKVNKNLLFYYLNLTIIDEKLTQDADYRIMMLNAINIDEEKFCKIFDPINKGGVTFQLLKNEYLRNTYCENCNK